jgi:hypothetical protein
MASPRSTRPVVVDTVPTSPASSTPTTAVTDVSPVWFLGSLLEGFASGYVQSQAARPVVINQAPAQPRQPLTCTTQPLQIGPPVLLIGRDTALSTVR